MSKQHNTNKRSPASERNRQILSALKRARKPMSAYDLIAGLRENGELAPQTVYRALQRLMDDGLVHRIESLNAFIACTHHAHDDGTAFAICSRCGTVAEFDAPAISRSLENWSGASKFSIAHTTVEVRGICHSCISIPPAS